MECEMYVPSQQSAYLGYPCPNTAVARVARERERLNVCGVCLDAVKEKFGDRVIVIGEPVRQDEKD